MEKTTLKSRHGLAILVMVGASLALAIQAMFVKLASSELSTNFLCFMRSVVNLSLLFFWILFSPSAPKFSTFFHSKVYSFHAVRSLCGVASLFCFYYSITKISLATGTLIYYSFPLFVPLVCRVWLGIKVIHRLWWGLGIAFLGLLIVLHPGRSLNPLDFIPLLGALLTGTSVVAVRKLNYSEPWEKITGYYFLLSVIATAAVLLLLS